MRLTRRNSIFYVSATLLATGFAGALAHGVALPAASAPASALAVNLLKKSEPGTAKMKEKLSSVHKPSRLPPKVRKQAIEDIRSAAGVKKRDLPSEPPVEISLTPLTPKSGNSWYNMTRGWSYPAGTGMNKTPFSAIAGVSANEPYYSYFLFYFETEQQKTYMLDCAVSSRDKGARWLLGGAFAGEIMAQQGHLIIGFVADSPATNLTMSIVGSQVGYLYGCELTQVN